MLTSIGGNGFVIHGISEEGQVGTRDFPRGMPHIRMRRPLVRLCMPPEMRARRRTGSARSRQPGRRRQGSGLSHNPAHHRQCYRLVAFIALGNGGDIIAVRRYVRVGRVHPSSPNVLYRRLATDDCERQRAPLILTLNG